MELGNKIMKGFDTYTRFYLKQEEPVVVLAPGRVGSIALNTSLRAAGAFSFKVEFAERETRGTAGFAVKHIFKKHKPAKLITLARDPIDMMLTYYMSKTNTGWLPEAKQALQNQDLTALQNHFITDVLQTDRFQSHIDWYTNDFQTLTGINVYDHPFDTEKRWSTIEHDTYPTLVLRTELNDHTKTTVIKDFLHLDSFTLTRANTAETKPYREIYQQFKQTLQLPADLVDSIYGHPYCTHFFSEAEIQGAKQKWAAL